MGILLWLLHHLILIALFGAAIILAIYFPLIARAQRSLIASVLIGACVSQWLFDHGVASQKRADAGTIAAITKQRDAIKQLLATATADNAQNVHEAEQLAAELSTCNNVKSLAQATESQLKADGIVRDQQLAAAEQRAMARRRVIYASPACVASDVPLCPAAEQELRQRRAALIKGD